MHSLPISFSIPLGLILALVGAILFFVTKLKKVAAILIAVGLMITVGMVALIGLASISMR